MDDPIIPAPEDLFFVVRGALLQRWHLLHEMDKKSGLSQHQLREFIRYRRIEDRALEKMLGGAEE